MLLPLPSSYQNIILYMFLMCFFIFLEYTHLPQVRSLFGEGGGTPLHYSCLANPMNGEAWQAAVHGVKDDCKRNKALSLGSQTRKLVKCTEEEEAQSGGVSLRRGHHSPPPTRRTCRLVVLKRQLHQNHLESQLKSRLQDFPGGPVVKTLPSNAGDAGLSDPWSRS